jgi:uncharacterized metal-binding protein
MSNGKEHAYATKQNLRISVGFTVGWSLARAVGGSKPWEIGFAVGQILGHLVTPDIDHPYRTYEEQRIYRRSKLLGHCWVTYWWLYQVLHQHRGTSHWVVYGTAERFLYLLWLPIGLSWYFLGWEASLFWGWVFLGWVMQDITHLRLDGYLSFRRR